MHPRQTILRLIMVVGISSVAFGGQPLQPFDISWYTVDGGGGVSFGGDFALAGTIGQPDTGHMSRGRFDLEGGFWPGAAFAGCGCLGDVNADGHRNGADVADFVNCLLNGDACPCADVNGMDGVDIDDVELFVQDLLTTTDCQ